MRDTVDIKPDRNTWRLFCEEPALTEEELALWTEIKRAIRSGDHYDDEMAEFFFTHNPLPERAERSADWSDLVQNADNHRRWVRAHFPLYEQWKARQQT